MVLDGLHASVKGGEVVNIFVKIDENGMLTAKAIDEKTKLQDTITIERPNQISDAMILNMKIAVNQLQQAADLASSWFGKQQESIQTINLNLKPVASMTKRKKMQISKLWGGRNYDCPIHGGVARADDVCVSGSIYLCDEGNEMEGGKEELEWLGEDEEHEENQNYYFQRMEEKNSDHSRQNLYWTLREKLMHSKNDMVFRCKTMNN